MDFKLFIHHLFKCLFITREEELALFSRYNGASHHYRLPSAGKPVQRPPPSSQYICLTRVPSFKWPHRWGHESGMEGDDKEDKLLLKRRSMGA